MTPLWIDYSGGAVSGATMAAHGITGAIRYVGVGGAGKRLTRAEYADHCAHGRQTVAVVELSTTDADGGAPAGTANATAALRDLQSITAGLPPITCVLMANDKPTYVQADLYYIQAAAAVFDNVALVGPYGFGSFLAACDQHGLAPIAWQAGPAPSRTGTAALATWWQRNGGQATASDGPSTPTTITLNGVVCDLSNQLLEIPMSDPWAASLSVTWPKGSPEATLAISQGAAANADGSVTESALARDWLTVMAGRVSVADAVTDPAVRQSLAALGSQESTDHAAELAALSTEQAAVIAAIHAVPAPVAQQVTADPTAVAAALESAGLPAAVGQALLSALARVAGGAS